MIAVKTIGRIIYAIGLAGLGLWSIIYGDFIVGRPPVSSWSVHLNPALGYVLGVSLIIAALFILCGYYVKYISWTIALLILIFSLPRHLVQFSTDWLNGFKAMAIMGGALITGYAHAKTNPPGWILKAGCILLAAFFIAGGYAHFKYAGFVKEFIPSYIPFRAFFTYFCGICLLAGGIGILLSFTRKWASILSACMLLGWFLLLHIPRFIADTSNKSDRLGLTESFYLAGVFICLYAITERRKMNM